MWCKQLLGGGHGFVHGESQTGIFVHENSAEHRDVLGLDIPVVFEIFDFRKNLGTEKKPTYSVSITDGTSKKLMLFQRKYDEVGVYSVNIQLSSPKWTTIIISMENDQGLHFEHTITLGYNVNFDKGLAWLVAFPAVLLAGLILLFDFQGNGGGGSDLTDELPIGKQ